MLEKQIEKYWNKRADGYNEAVQEEMACQKKQAWESLLLKYIGQGENLQVLDVGTGPGFFAIVLAGLNYSVTAVDKCQDMLAQAGKNAEAGENIRFLKADAHAIDLPNESFDAIVSRNVTWLMPNPLEVYREWYRLLKPSGKVLVFDANWYLHLSNPEFKILSDKYRRLALEKGYQDTITPEQKEESDAIARKLPLTYEMRPSWDQYAFRSCGFQQIEVEENISPLVHDEIEQILYYPTPMFAICATK
ncbi:class I SAM-dependent methyltransferase [Desulfosporosinus sp. PR]|uniref:class I SAM-dependent methyltransferase n=1 Tax=Candidatus Desulfosporosinus nitrosoreducens TaxID=3401928 RepID=UPI0027F6E010|nr:class I SAM-dependent methyltransferase [Desulfosporosinus sp. PR]MDQ7093792.1 class I SAM-dependent methyltransferase [Desulfosporosinus sp. PR]